MPDPAPDPVPDPAPSNVVQVPDGEGHIVINTALVAAVIPRGDDKTLIHFAGGSHVVNTPFDAVAAALFGDDPDPNP